MLHPLFDEKVEKTLDNRRFDVHNNFEIKP